MKVYIPFLFLVLTLSCQVDKKDAEIVQLEKLEKELELQPSEERARNFLKSINTYLSNHYSDFALTSPYLKIGAEISKKYGFLDMSPNYLLPLLRSKENTEDKFQRKIELGDVMININKQHASNVIYKELLRQKPNDSEIIKRQVLIDSVALAQSDYVQYLFDQILINPDESGINKSSALKYVDAAEALALVSTDNPKTADYLYKAAEVARSMRTMPKAMSIYDWILEDYPNYEKAPTVLFIKGFIMEQDFKKIDEAKAIYTEFVTKYPNHQMASSAQFLLDNMGKSEEEILKSMEAKHKTAQSN